MTHEEATGKRLSVGEIQDLLRRMSIQSWLYQVARLDAHLVFNQIIDPGTEDQLIGGLFSPELRDGIVEAWKRHGRRIPVFHRHQLLVFTRLLLATPGVPVGASTAEAKFEPWVGTALLAVNDLLAADVEDDLKNDKLASEDLVPAHHEGPLPLPAQSPPCSA